MTQAELPAGLFRRLFAKPWMPYAEQPFKKARQVVNYIGRYSHSIAISNYRIKNIEGDRVTFSYKTIKKWAERGDAARAVGVYPPFCQAYYSTPLCSHSTLWDTLQPK